MPTLLFFPLLPFLLEVGLVLYFVFTSAMLYSAGDLVPHLSEPSDSTDIRFGINTSSLALETPSSESHNITANISREACASDPNCYYAVEWDNTLKYMFLYHLFGLLWTNQFIIGLGYVTIAGAVANFYWSRADPRTNSFSPVRRSIHNTFRYHLGKNAVAKITHIPSSVLQDPSHWALSS